MRILTEIEIIRRAHANGSENLPATYDLEPDEVQLGIVNAGEEDLAELRQRTHKELQRCGLRLNREELSPVDLDVQGPVNDAVHEFAVLRARTRDKLIQRRIAEREMFRELRHFKAENGLYRSAHYPKSRIFASSLPPTIIVGEAILNARLFAEADPVGILGGWLFALLVSAANVLPSFLLGGVIVFRNLHHARPLRRMWAAIGVLAFIALVVGFNLFLAHLRIAMGIDPDHAMTLAGPYMRDHLFDITADVQAVFLFWIGFFAALCAALDGYCLFDDRYPRYGKLDRRYRATVAAYEATKDAFRKGIARNVKKAHATISRRLKRIQKKVECGARIINAGLVRVGAAEECADALACRTERLLRVYRNENKRVRTKPAPAYFTVFPSIDTSLGADSTKLREKKRRLIELLEAKMQEAILARARLRDLADQEVERLVRLEDDVEVTVSTKSAAPPVAGYLLEGAAQ